MSLVSLALRVAVARALVGQTFAEGRVYDSAIAPLDGAIEQRDDLAVSRIGLDLLEERTERRRAALKDLDKARVDVKKSPRNSDGRIFHLRPADEILDLVFGPDGSRLADIGDTSDQMTFPPMGPDLFKAAWIAPILQDRPCSSTMTA